MVSSAARLRVAASNSPRLVIRHKGFDHVIIAVNENFVDSGVLDEVALETLAPTPVKGR